MKTQVYFPFNGGDQPNEPSVSEPLNAIPHTRLHLRHSQERLSEVCRPLGSMKTELSRACLPFLSNSSSAPSDLVKPGELTHVNQGHRNWQTKNSL